MKDYNLSRLAIAPELIVVDVVADALVALEHALLAAHPALDGACPCEDHHPIQRRARAILRRACRLNRALNRYRTEANEILDLLPRGAERDDIGF